MKTIISLLATLLLSAWLMSGCASAKSAETKEDFSAKLNQSKADAETSTQELRDLRMEKARIEAEKGDAGAGSGSGQE